MNTPDSTLADPTPADPIITAVTAAITAGHEGHRAQARQQLEDLWRGIGDQGDPAHRCILAHSLADLQDSAEAELTWDERAMAATEELTDERLQRIHPTLTVQGFLPSLHLNLADDHRMLGRFEQAHTHLAAAAQGAQELPDDAYGKHLREGVQHVTEALDARTTQRLPTHP
jgi:hypothetical protein